MKIVLILLVLLTSNSFAQQWAVSAGGTNTEFAYSICADQSGNSYVTGYFVNSISFGSTTLNAYAAGNYCIYIAKYNSAGTFQWAVRCGNNNGTSTSMARGIRCDASGNVYVTGTWGFNAIFGTDSVYSNYGSNVFVSKLNSSGVWQWTLTGIGQVARGIALDGSGNCYVTGSYDNFATFGSTTLNTAGSTDIYIAKCNSSGWLWAQSAGGSGGDVGTSIAVDASSNVYISGSFSSTANFGSASVSSNGGNDIYVAKYNSSGTFQWVQSAGGAGSDISQSIAVDGSGNLYISGQFANTVNFGSNSISSYSGLDAFVVKYNSSGTAQWAIAADNSSGGTASGFGVACDGSGVVYVCGGYTSAISFGSNTLTSSGATDVFEIRLTTSGTVLGAVSFGGSGSDNAYAIDIDPSSNQFIGGYFNNTAYFGSTQLTSAGGNDVFVTKIAAPTANISLSNPTGGQSFCIGSSISIQWTSSLVNNVNIQLSSDAGSNYSTIATTSSQNGSNSYSYSIPSTTAPLSTYRIRVVDASNSSVSGASTSNFSINTPVVITTQPSPSSQSLCSGASVSLSITVSGSNPSYQWRKDGSAISGQTASTYNITNYSLAQNGSYDCVVSGCSAPVTSSSVTLTLSPSTTITIQPQDITTCIGRSAVFSLTATGNGLNYQWKKDGSVIANATSNTYQIPVALVSDTGSYNCMVSGTCGSAVSSIQAHLSVYDNPVFSDSPSSTTVCEGTKLQLSVTVKNSVNTVFEWTKDAMVLTNSQHVSGVNTPVLTINSVNPSDAGSYSLRAGQCGNMVSTSPAVLSVRSIPTITTQPQSQVLPSGASLSLSVNATGDDLHYQWLLNDKEIAAATSASFSIKSLKKVDEGDYSVVLKNACGERRSSAAHIQISDSAISVLSLESTILDFGTARVGSTKSRDFLIQNTGTAKLTVTELKLSGVNSSDFKVDPSAFVLQPTESKKLRINFQPVTIGSKECVIEFVCNSAGTKQLSLRARASLSNWSVADVNLGQCEIGRERDTLVSLCNTSGTSLQLDNIELLGDTSIVSLHAPPMSSTSPVILSEDSCIDIELKFHPHSVGTVQFAVRCHSQLSTDTVSVHAQAIGSTEVPGSDNSTQVLAIPNPACSFISLCLPGNAQQASIRLIDQLGTIVLERETYQTQSLLSIEQLVPGCYCIVITINNRQYRNLLIISR